MTRTTILLETDLMLRLRQLASANGKTVTSLIREAIAVYLEQQQTKRKFSFTAAGRSGKGNLSVDAEKILKQRFRRKGKA